MINEENETVTKALKRLDARQSYDRIFRIRRAMQCSLSHKLLPKSEWTKDEEDVPYLSPIIAELEAEARERKELDTLTISKSH